MPTAHCRATFCLVFPMIKIDFVARFAQVSPPYDVSDTTSLQALRLIVEVMGSLVAHDKMGNHKPIIDKEFTAF